MFEGAKVTHRVLSWEDELGELEDALEFEKKRGYVYENTMNEQIFQIAKQCGNWNGETVEMNDVGIQKFAELIVKDCADFLMDTMDDHFAAEQLIEHFGVK